MDKVKKMSMFLLTKWILYFNHRLSFPYINVKEALVENTHTHARTHARTHAHTHTHKRSPTLRGHLTSVSISTGVGTPGYNDLFRRETTLNYIFFKLRIFSTIY